MYQPSPPLERAKHEDDPQMEAESLADPPSDEEIEEGDEKHQTDQPAPQTVGVLEPEDEFEIVKRHAGIQHPVFRIALVIAEERLPFAVAERRHDAEEGFPFDHGKP